MTNTHPFKSTTFIGNVPDFLSNELVWFFFKKLNLVHFFYKHEVTISVTRIYWLGPCRFVLNDIYDLLKMLTAILVFDNQDFQLEESIKDKYIFVFNENLPENLSMLL